MEKLSSVIPASPRVKSVDLKNAKPVRPGAPTYGSPVGMTSRERDRIVLSSEAKDLAFQETMGARNPREMRQAQMVDEVTRRFFETRLNQPDPNVMARGDRVAIAGADAPENVEETAAIKTGKLDVQA